MEKEIWFTIDGYEGLYEISNLGLVRSLDRTVSGRIKGTNKNIKGKIKSNINIGGYNKVQLCKNGICKQKFIHRLYATLFIPNPENKKEINHKNGIRDDNRLENLEWCTRSENQLHSFHTLGQKTVAKRVGQYTLDGKFIKEYSSLILIERQLGYKPSNIGACCRLKKYYNTAYGYKWKFL